MFKILDVPQLVLRIRKSGSGQLRQKTGAKPPSQCDAREEFTPKYLVLLVVILLIIVIVTQHCVVLFICRLV